MYFAHFIGRVVQVINRPGLFQAYTPVAFGVIATPEQGYWETSAEQPQGKRCDGLEGAWEVRGKEQSGRNSPEAGSTHQELYHWLCWIIQAKGKAQSQL